MFLSITKNQTTVQTYINEIASRTINFVLVNHYPGNCHAIDFEYYIFAASENDYHIRSVNRKVICQTTP